MLFPAASSSVNTTLRGLINLIQTRTKVIYHMPKPTEVKRVRKQGFKTRTQTKIGRQYIMMRLLKGDKVLSQ